MEEEEMTRNGATTFRHDNLAVTNIFFASRHVMHATQSPSTVAWAFVHPTENEAWKTVS